MHSNIKKQKYVRIVNPISWNDIQVNINELDTWVDKNLFDFDRLYPEIDFKAAQTNQIESTWDSPMDLFT